MSGEPLRPPAVVLCMETMAFLRSGQIVAGGGHETMFDEALVPAVRALVAASDYGLSLGPLGGGGWVAGPGLRLPSKARTPSRLMRLVRAGLAEHEIRRGYSMNARHHYWRATDAARAVLAQGLSFPGSGRSPVMASPRNGHNAADRFLDALDDLIIEDILSMTGDELRAEIIAEGGDPDAMVREASAAIERAVEAARSGYLLDRGDQPIPRLLGLPDPLVTGQAAAVEQPTDGRLRLDEGALHSPEGALADLLPQRGRGGGVVGEDVGHAGESEAVPVRGQPRNDAEAPAGKLPAVWSAW